MIRILSAVLILLSAALFCGCGKRAPEPPRVRMTLVLDILDDIAAGKHREALAQIRRYKELDQTNVFIAELESIERANIHIGEAENALQQQDQAGAERAIREAIRVVGPVPELTKAANDLRLLAELEMLAYRIEQPENSAELAANLELFRQKASAFPNNGALADYAQKRQALVRKLKIREDHLAVYDLESDGFRLRATDPARADVLEAERLIEQKM